jgi:putative DNA primase/helicase
LLEALQAICILPKETEQPVWLNGRKTGAIVALRNGLLDVERRVLMPHSIHFFNTTGLDFDYEPNAPKPEKWLHFLHEIWGDEAPIQVLGEWFGYVISGRTDLQKILLHVGPSRGGKGVIGRILGTLLGKRNVVGPTLHSFGGEFGLEQLIGKSLAVVSDARFKIDSVVVERLLTISGEDTVTINRKNRSFWTGKLPTRLQIISNELPKLNDASTAVIGRFIVLLSTKSWLGKEDETLFQTLCEELTGILNYSLDGLQQLINNKNRFTRIEAFDDAIIQMRDLASPVAAFVRQQCELGPKLGIKCDDLYGAYKTWAEAHGHRVMTSETFGRDLRAVVPGLRKTRPRDKEGPDKGKPFWRYTGIDIRIDP